MNKLKYLVILSLLLHLYGCFAPLNSVYDNAKLLKKNEVRVGASYSRYYGTTYDIENYLDPSFDNLNNNVGVSLGYGLSEKVNLTGRYESFNLKWQSDIFGETEAMRLNYFELGVKIRLKEDKMALAIPVGFYFIDGEFITSLDPRFFLTISESKTFDFTIIPKAHIFFTGGLGVLPGFSFNVGLSKDLDKWAIRPEIGYDGYLNFGIGANVNFGKK